MLAAFAVAVMATYILVMIRTFDIPHHDWYIGQSTTQLRRVLGLSTAAVPLPPLVGSYTSWPPSTSSSFPAFSSHWPRSFLLSAGCFSATGPATGSPPWAMRCCSAGW